MDKISIEIQGNNANAMLGEVERNSVYDSAKVTESDGTVRIIPPLYFGQMIYRDKNGNFRYSRDMPKDYWKKKEFLEKKGWKCHYHYNLDWQKGDYNDRLGIKIDDAFNKELSL